MMQKSTIFTTIFRIIKKCYFHYDFSCIKVLLSLQYAKKKYIFLSQNKKTTTQFVSVLSSKNSVEFFLVNPFSSFFFILFLYQNKKVTTQFFSALDCKKSLEFFLVNPFIRFFLFCCYLKIKRSQHNSSQFCCLFGL
jgi:hypothetical protein